MDAGSLAASLRAVVGDDGVLTPPDGLSAYNNAARYDGGQAALVVRPRSTKEVSAVVAGCALAGVRLVPQGANTGLVAGSTADGTGRQVVLSLERLTGTVEIDAVNRTARVAAGIRLSTLNAALEPYGLFLPIDLGADPTIGGMAATNTGGARFIRYGDMRRQVLGLQVVLADASGTVVELKGGLRKDNTGLDLRQLFVGSGGALGVITAVEVELQPRPRQAAAALVALSSPEAALPLLMRLERDAGAWLTAFEGMSRPAISAALAHAPGLRNPFPAGAPDYAVLIELSSSRPERDDEPPLSQALEVCLAEWMETEGGDAVDVLVGRPEPLWALRHAISEGLRAKGRVIGFDLAFRRSDVAPFRAAAVEVLARDFPEMEVCDFGHIGDGGVHFNLVAAADAALTPARLDALRMVVYDLAVRRFGGSFSGEHGLGRANIDGYRAFTPKVVRRLSGDIQAVFATAPFGAVDFIDLAKAPA